MRRRHIEHITDSRREKIDRAENFNDHLLSPSTPIDWFKSHFIAAQDVPPISEEEENTLKDWTTKHKINKNSTTTRTIRVYGKIKCRPNSPYCTIAGCVRKAGSLFPKCKSHWGKKLNFTRNKRDQICKSTEFVSEGTVLRFLYSASGTRKVVTEVTEVKNKNNKNRLLGEKKNPLIPSLRGFPSIKLDSSKDPKNLPARYFRLSSTDYNLELIPFYGDTLYKRVLLTKERYINNTKDNQTSDTEDEDDDEVPVASVIYCCPILAVRNIPKNFELVLKC